MSENFLQLIEKQASTRAQASAIVGDKLNVSYARLMDEVTNLIELFQMRRMRRIAIVLSNCPAWIALDLAALKVQRTFIAVPHFFSPTQIEHLLRDAEVDTLICDGQLGVSLAAQFGLVDAETIMCLGSALCIARRESIDTYQSLPPEHVPATGNEAAVKISYTSGTTGDPKGVLISFELIDNTVRAVLNTIHPSHAKRHLNVLPFSLLLENIVGIYAVLASGGCCHTPSASSLGMDGSSSVEWTKFAQAIQTTEPSSMITVPALLQGLIYCVSQLGLDASALKTIAVGGAPISTAILKQAQDLGLPVFQGYGMTECGSVVCLNTPEQNQIGSVGKPLPHVTIRINAHDEIIVGGINFPGYVHQESSSKCHEWHTGDLGYLDEQGYLFITARKSSTYSTAYGRNIAPEWVESELDGEMAIAQSVVFGEAEKTNIAIIVPIADHIEDASLADCVARANQRLPDYAQVSKWARAASPFDAENGQRSPSGSLNRSQLYTDYQSTIKALFIDPSS